MSDLTRKKLLLFCGRQAGKQINKKYISTYGETTIYIEQQEWLRPEGEFYSNNLDLRGSLVLGTVTIIVSMGAKVSYQQIYLVLSPSHNVKL